MFPSSVVDQTEKEVRGRYKRNSFIVVDSLDV